MTAREVLDGIQARIQAATPGLWAIDKHDTGPFESIVSIANDYPGGWVEVARSLGADAKLITNAPTDMARLTAALEAALAVADDLQARGDAIEEKGNNGSIYSHRAEGRGIGYREAQRLIRNAIEGALQEGQ